MNVSHLFSTERAVHGPNYTKYTSTINSLRYTSSDTTLTLRTRETSGKHAASDFAALFGSASPSVTTQDLPTPFQISVSA